MQLPIPQTIEVFTKNKLLNGLKILHLSDLHINKKTKNSTLKNLVLLSNTLEYDFLVITGDIIDCKVKYIESKLNILNSIEKKVFYISGNHDLVYGLKSLNKVLKNFIFIDNSFYSFHYNDEIITIAGLSDRFSKFFFHERNEKKIIDILRKSDNSILLAHQPKDYKIAVDNKSSLFLCGHTHGGQIYPFHYIVKLFQPFLSGLIYKDETAIYVNKGLGNWGIDFRYKASNEISIIKLTSKEIQ
jgi:predicted MPP superfamily phosphohydrolase